jgi:hypothetical protein
MAEPDEKNTFLDGDITNLALVTIQLHEMFKELQKSGFTHAEALQLTGIVLSSGAMFNYEDFDEDEGDEEDYGDEEDGEEFLF